MGTKKFFFRAQKLFDSKIRGSGSKVNSKTQDDDCSGRDGQKQ